MKVARELASKEKHDSKLILTYIRSKMDTKEEIRALKDDEGRLRVDRSDIANILSNHFESVFVKESMGTLPEFENEPILASGSSVY